MQTNNRKNQRKGVGRKPKLDPAIHRYVVRLTSEENGHFDLSLNPDFWNWMSKCPFSSDVNRTTHVTSIIGFRNKDLLILEDEFKACSDVLRVMTDDGSYGEHGNVTVPLKEMLEAGEKFDMIITIGPLIMMKFVVATAKPFGTPVTASMNPIMIDGTGMCGGCRLTLNVDGKKVTKFACVDGPDFNGYEIDFDEAMSRGRMYADFERHAYENSCNLFKKEVQ